MLVFTKTTAGATEFEKSSVPINTIVLYSDAVVAATITDFSGAVTIDSQIGEYAVISFTDNSSNTYSANKITIGNTANNTYTSYAEAEVPTFSKANSTDVLKMRVSCKFVGASKCAFDSTIVNLPYATDKREGVIRIAADGESNKAGTVYSAAAVDDIITDVVSGGVELTDYVPWDKSGSPAVAVAGDATLKQLKVVNNYSSPTASYTATITNSSGTLTVDKPLSASSLSATGAVSGASASITGAVSSATVSATSVSSALFTGDGVVSSPTISSGAITDTTDIVNGSYIASLYSNVITVGTTDSKLVTSYAVSTYVASSAANLVHITETETISGTKTFSAATTFSTSVSSPSYIGTGVQSSTSSWNDSSNNSKIPTVEVVSAALSSLNTTLSGVDTGLQSQIDAINAGQNLADIVNTKTALASHSLTNLKAAGEGSITIGDKIQVLHDTTKSDGTYDDSTDDKIAAGIATVYELIKGSIDTSSYQKDVDAVTTGYYWHYIGEYGSDSYSKSTADTTFVKIASLVGSAGITDGSTTVAPSADGVYDFVTSAISTAASNYVKLSSAYSQTVASPLVFKASSVATATLSIPDGQSVTANNTLTVKADNSTNSVSTVYDLSNVAYTVKLGSNSALDLRKTSSTADASGDLVASYRDYSGSLTDGRLVTVDYMTHYTGSMSAYATLSGDNAFTGSNTFNNITVASGYSISTPSVSASGTVSANAVSSTTSVSAATMTATTSVTSALFTGDGVYSTYSSSTWASATTQVPTVSTVKSAISDSASAIQAAVSDNSKVGAVGLFIYTEAGDQKSYGSVVNGIYLKAVGMSLPYNGEITYSASSSTESGSWKLLSVALKRTATSPCLVLAVKTSTSAPS